MRINTKKLKQTAFFGASVMTKEQLKKVVGGVGSDSAYCTYVMKDGGAHTEEGMVSNPPGSGYGSAREYAEAMCASDPMCISVSC
ncbi:hypothetical protein VRU48_16450 [Pedobacter sp. KR3-3]|uniref:Bacteriocin n=1 Tax=Pedobacter albus TaxID=3113905 RepID=A0ABU7IBH0_9SPHI|nr:hypothetical protein [Pedobacter sp. KR3-3]MEE1946717.1 hypothetical protein [Pedobacter sp. KR3-3]